MAQSAWIVHVAKTRSEMKKSGKKFKPTDVFREAAKTYKKSSVSTSSKKHRKSKKNGKTRKVKKAKKGKKVKKGGDADADAPTQDPPAVAAMESEE